MWLSVVMRIPAVYIDVVFSGPKQSITTIADFPSSSSGFLQNNN